MTNCLSCGAVDIPFSDYCGAHVCHVCGHHQHGNTQSLARCYCGWSRTAPGRGRQELVEMGETIDPEPEP